VIRREELWYQNFVHAIAANAGIAVLGVLKISQSA